MCNEALEKAIEAEGRRLIREALDLWKAEQGKQMQMTLNEYQQLAARTINHSLSEAAKEMHAVHGMCAEVGELQGLYQKMFQGHQWDKGHALKELGDLLWFIAEYCTACGVTLEDVARMNVDKLKKRYPDGFEEDRSLHRADGDI